MRIAIVGASGQLGATLVEHLKAGRPDVDVVPFIHSSGNAWRLARRQIALSTLDLLDSRGVARALEGCTHVVNCSRGDADVMFQGLQNLLDGARRNSVRRFVHISSVLVYGDPPHPDSGTEAAPADLRRLEPKSYGWIKLRQDQMVSAAAGRGLNSIILCPPNIIGPYSQFLTGLATALRRREFALVSDRDCPINVVDVSNLVRAIECALDRGPSNGSRFFVTDNEDVTWRMLVDRLRLVLGEDGTRESRAIDAATLAQLKGSSRVPPPSIVRALKHLVSSDVREVLRADPLIASWEEFAKRAVSRSSGALEARMRQVAAGPVEIRKTSPWDGLNVALSAQQLRGVRHSSEAAHRAFGYRPDVTFDQSMDAFSEWYRVSQGMDTEAWPLLRHLA